MQQTFSFIGALSAVVLSIIAVPTRAQNAPTVAWQKMPLLPPEAKKAGVFPGGEGAQWPRWEIEISRTDPNFMLLPIDVGGLYRSLDGGQNWQQSSAGWNARGANCFAIDPQNANRVLGVAGNSMDWDLNWGQSPNGIYLSENKGESWRQVLAVPDGLNNIVVYDPSSYNAQTKQCDVAYFASYSRGLFRSSDGGATWKAVSRLPIDNRNADNTSALLKIHPTKGTVYLAGKNGFYFSQDGGQNWTHSYDGASVWGLSVSESAPDSVWISGAMGAMVSRDGGRTFAPLALHGITRKADEAVRNLNVSPVDAKRMLCWVQGDNWQWMRYVSQDGGQNWQPIKIERGLAARDEPLNTMPGGWAPLPYNVRNGFFAWHPTNANVVFGLGGDWVTKSSDGGQTFRWSNNGYNGIMLGRSLNFSAHDPNTVFLAFQDYNGAFTLDGGATWNYRDVSGKGWGGQEYGGYAVDKQVMWCGDAETWESPRRTRISRDGGQTWNFATDAAGKPCEWSSAEISYSDPKNINTLFASCWRSTDKGATWAKMGGCDGVYISAPDGTLIGRKDDNIITSKDGGASWQTIVAVPGGFRDVAFDWKRSKYYVASQERLKTWDAQTKNWQTLDTPKNQYGGTRVEAVAVDPVVPDVVYGGGPNNIFASAATVFRSTDGGQSWANLTTGSGPHEVAVMRVHPITRELWLNGQCYGMWRLAAPATLGQAPQVLANAPVAPVAPLAVALPAAVKEGVAMSNTIADFGPANLNYHYGESWKVGENITTGDSEGVGFLQIDSTEHGGGGLVLNGVNIAPQQQTHLALRARLLPGNKAGLLNVNLVRDEANGGNKTLSFDLSKLDADSFSILTLPLGEGDFSKIQQIQLQGTNWSAGAQPLKIQIDRIGTTTLDAKANAQATQVAQNSPTNGPPAKDKPDVAGWGFWPDFPQAWMAMANGFVERSKKGDVDIVFLGDSITQGWGGEGKAIFDEKYAPLKAVNYGIGGDTTRQIMWRIEHGMFDGITPKLVVLKIGTNNLYDDVNSGSDEEIAAGITKIVREIRAQLPNTKVLLLGVLPRQNAYFSQRAKNINALIATDDDGKNVRFLDMSEQFQTELGKVRPELYVPDQLHLATKGYQVWAETMAPLFEQMLQ